MNLFFIPYVAPLSIKKTSFRRKNIYPVYNSKRAYSTCSKKCVVCQATQRNFYLHRALKLCSNTSPGLSECERKQINPRERAGLKERCNYAELDKKERVPRASLSLASARGRRKQHRKTFRRIFRARSRVNAAATGTRTKSKAAAAAALGHEVLISWELRDLLPWGGMGGNIRVVCVCI